MVDDDPLQRRALERSLRREGFDVAVAGRADEALGLVAESPVAVAIVDLGLPDLPGLELLGRIADVRPAVQCIVLTGSGRQEARAEARLAGAADYFEKGSMDLARLVQVVRRAAEVHHLRETIGLLDAERSRSRLLGDAPSMQALRRSIERMAGTTAAVLVQGESGVGKEVVAETLHERSGRTGQLVRINCAALPEALVEAELFGAEEGTFTGQKGRREGLFSLARGGTLFLDEIGEMPLGLQPKLLRVLQERSFRPLGSPTERELTARVVAATNVDLRAAVRAGTFREDLYFRLAVLTLDVPPLRERRSDVPLLAASFVKRFAVSEGRAGVRLSEEALEALVAHAWPGNVRELANTLLRAVVLTASPVIGIEDLGPGFGAPSRAAEPPPATVLPPLPDQEALLDLPLTEAKAAAADQFARVYVTAKLRAAGGNVTRAAALAGMQRPNFKREMRRLGIGAEGEPPDPDARPRPTRRAT